MRVRDKRAERNGSHEPIDPDAHTWTVIMVLGLTEEQAREYADPDNEIDENIQAMIIDTQGPTCWVCEKTWEEVNGQPCTKQA